MEMAVDALESFFKNSIQGHDGTVNIQLIGFGTSFKSGADDLVITADMNEAARQQVYERFSAILENWQKEMFTKNYSQGTNYEAAMEKATEWFNGHKNNGGENLAFFISDGQPTYYNSTDWWGNSKVAGTGNSSNQDTVKETLAAAQDLQNAGGGVKVNAIGIGTNTSLSKEGQEILDLIDNTGGSGQIVVKYPYQLSSGNWTNTTWREEKPLAEGDSDLVNTADGLAAALVGGSEIISTALAPAGNDAITAENSTSSTIIYGDVMNSDRLLHELKQNVTIADMVAAGMITALPGYGSGSEVFQWLEKNSDKLTGDYAGWTREDSIKYMLDHADELGYETRVDTDGNPYLVAPDGTVWNLDGSEAMDVDLDGLTGRGGGDDIITGSSASDIIYGQEGHDTIYGGSGHDTLYGGTGNDLLVGDDKPESLAADTVEEISGLSKGELDAFIESVEGTDADGNDRLFGGSGDDVLLGMGGDDYLDGGEGSDAIFGGAGNDIIVYDQQDYLVSGGSGIDFMVSDDTSLTLDGLLSNTGSDKPLVSGIEVLLKGEDALSLTSIKDLADRYGITLGVNEAGEETLQLDDRWTKQADGSYDFNGGAEADGGLTLETNLTPVETSDPASEAVQQQVFTLEHSNG